MIDLSPAIEAMIRLLAEEDSQGRYRVYFDNEDFLLVSQIFHLATWIPIPVPRQVRMPHPIPTVVQVDRDYDERARPLYSGTSAITIGRVSFFGADFVPMRSLRKTAGAVRTAHLWAVGKRLQEYVKAIYKAAGPDYNVNVSRNSIYLYRCGG